jgi:hypothetical protein
MIQNPGNQGFNYLQSIWYVPEPPTHWEYIAWDEAGLPTATDTVAFWTGIEAHPSASSPCSDYVLWQPVLFYGYNAGLGATLPDWQPGWWIFAYGYNGVSNQTFYYPPIAVNAGDEIDGEVLMTGSLQYEVWMEDVTTSYYDYVYVNFYSGWTYSQVDTGVLEQMYVTNCDEFPPSGTWSLWNGSICYTPNGTYNDYDCNSLFYTPNPYWSFVQDHNWGISGCTLGGVNNIQYVAGSPQWAVTTVEW